MFDDTETRDLGSRAIQLAHVACNVPHEAPSTSFSELDPDRLLLAADVILAEELEHWEQRSFSVGDHLVRSGP